MYRVKLKRKFYGPCSFYPEHQDLRIDFDSQERGSTKNCFELCGPSSSSENDTNISFFNPCGPRSSEMNASPIQLLFDYVTKHGTHRSFFFFHTISLSSTPSPFFLVLVIKENGISVSNYLSILLKQIIGRIRLNAFLGSINHVIVSIPFTEPRRSKY
ncbi:hypothetical protein NPIL_702711 [Nephila pilipes]|uniref:Uncharacterized protein n=1 Tax=Nephila pilipes TaxID=299642 RepID=A0A8X6T8L0_NEPPI|nr:hypothetical protein NPIL_702711 [Nephila pilipes]